MRKKSVPIGLVRIMGLFINPNILHFKPPPPPLGTQFPLPPNHCTPYLSVSNPKSGACLVVPLCYLLPLHPGQLCLVPLMYTFLALKSSSRCMSCGPSTFQPTVFLFHFISFLHSFLITLPTTISSRFVPSTPHFYYFVF